MKRHIYLFVTVLAFVAYNNSNYDEPANQEIAEQSAMTNFHGAFFMPWVFERVRLNQEHEEVLVICTIRIQTLFFTGFKIN